MSIKVDLGLILEKIIKSIKLQVDYIPDWEIVKNIKHGEWSNNILMRNKNIKDSGAEIIALLSQEAIIRYAKIEGQGFINIGLEEYYIQYSLIKIINSILSMPSMYGNTVILEFVSANPTGPLHVGHARQAVIGDVLANIIQSTSKRVHKEFYYNDAGKQIDNLAKSIQSRLEGIKPGDAEWPEHAYMGEYISELAISYKEEGGDSNYLENIAKYAINKLRIEQNADLAALGVEFDEYYLESELHKNNKIQEILDLLASANNTYAEDGALWLKTTLHGDDKDRVIITSDGRPTYFLVDIAYHLDKWRRGYKEAINIHGVDHHNSSMRVKAGLQLINQDIPSSYPNYLLHNMVKVIKDGKEVKVSKRAGTYVTLKDLVDKCGKDVVRYFLLSKNPGTEFVFDIDKAVAKSMDNPVYYIQYSHARAASILNKSMSASPDKSTEMNSAEKSIIYNMSLYSNLLLKCYQDIAPERLSDYLYSLSKEFHSYYNSTRIIQSSYKYRFHGILIVMAVKKIIAHGLKLMGISSPEKM